MISCESVENVPNIERPFSNPSFGWRRSTWWRPKENYRPTCACHYCKTYRADGTPGADKPGAGTLRRIRAENVEPPVKLWECDDGMVRGTATVGFGRSAIDGSPGIRVELLSALTDLKLHKERVIVAKNLHADLAEQIGTALIEAAQAAREGRAATTKRSAE